MDRPDATTLHEIVADAGRAPSVHNTQPWSWVVHTDSLELRADWTRHLARADRSARDLVISCGAALETLRVAARARGWATEVRHLPDAGDPTSLAVVDFSPCTPTEQDLVLGQAVERRHTDRREVTSWPVPQGRVENLGRLATERGVLASPALDEGQARQVFDLLVAARRVQSLDPAYADELLRWTNTEGDDGIPSTSLLTSHAAAEVAGSVTRFPVGSLDDDDDDVEDLPAAATWAVLATSSDDEISWLRTGEALAAIWLDCTVHGLSLVPYTQLIEVETTRSALQADILGDWSFPQVVLRLGWPPVSRDQADATRRRRVEDVLSWAEPAASRPPVDDKA